MILHGLRRIRAGTAIKYFIASNLAILLNNGFTASNAQTNEQWPTQPHLELSNKYLGPISLPPYYKHRHMILEGSALFFKSRRALDTYRNERTKLEDLLQSGLIVKLSPGRRLKPLETITTFEGRVADEQLGDGYVIMRRPF